MAYAIVLLLGMIGGGICVFVATDTMRRRITAARIEAEAEAARIQIDRRALDERQQELNQMREQSTRERDERIRADKQALEKKQEELNQIKEQLTRDRAEFDSRSVTYNELRGENLLLKRDLRNIDVNLRKLELDGQLRDHAQHELDLKCRDLASRYLKENVKWLNSSLTPNNFVRCKQRLQDVIERCRGLGHDISEDEAAGLLGELKQDYERIVRAAFEREEQVRIRAQIREEQAREKEIERELKRLEREREAIAAALAKALAEAKDEHSAEIEGLRARLAEAEANKERAISQAQLTKSGHVYVISNVGSFGEGVFKVGMTRRLEPMDRVKELGDASVPFPFDVHMMISADDAPTLENALHRELHTLRLNKVNPRKEFFRVHMDRLRELVEEHHGEVQYEADAEALEYRQSLEASDEDEEFIEGVYAGLTDDEETSPSED